VEGDALLAVPWCGGYCALRETFDLVYADATPHPVRARRRETIARTTMLAQPTLQGGSMAARKKAAKRGAKKTAKRGAKKTAKRGAKKTAKRGAKKTAKRGAKKSAKRGAKKSAKKAAS
jgi:hypothetical protein